MTLFFGLNGVEGQNYPCFKSIGRYSFTPIISCSPARSCGTVMENAFFAPIHQRFPRSSFRMTTNGITTPWKETHFVDNDVAIEAMQTNPSAKRARRERGVLTGNNENTAFMWWEDHLRSAGWIKFRPRECENVGFIPVQYTAGVFPRNVVRHVLKHGERGTHYAIGWWQLYEIVMSYGELAPRQNNGEQIILDYKGPRLDERRPAQQPDPESGNKQSRSHRSSSKDAREKIRAMQLDDSDFDKNLNVPPKPLFSSSHKLKAHPSSLIKSSTSELVKGAPIAKPTVADSTKGCVVPRIVLLKDKKNIAVHKSKQNFSFHHDPFPTTNSSHKDPSTMTKRPLKKRPLQVERSEEEEQQRLLLLNCAAMEQGFLENYPVAR